MSKTKGYFEDAPEPLPADGYGKPRFRPTCKDNPWIYDMPEITLEYAEIDGVRHARYVTAWVECLPGSQPTCYQYDNKGK